MRTNRSKTKTSKTYTTALAIAQAWQGFVQRWNSGADTYMDSLDKEWHKCHSYSTAGKLIHLHRIARRKGLPCMVPRVPREWSCPMCRDSSGQIFSSADLIADEQGPQRLPQAGH